MESATRSRKIGRTVRVFTLAAVGVGAAACAAVLGIEDRELVGSTTVAEAGDAPTGKDSSMDSPAIPDGPIQDGGTDGPIVRCEPTSCSDAGGSCDGGTCTISCAAGSCNGVTRKCPPGSDCALECSEAGSCDSVKCVGGHACTLLCSGAMSCKNGVFCEAERCDFQCVAESCKTLPPTCDAAICIANCAGDKSCDKGIDFRASQFCGITCSGSPSCNTAGSLIRCVSPDASIDCANATDTCKDGKPQCFGPANSFCAIKCRAPSSCSVDYCCDAGTCSFQGNGQQNQCP